MSIVFNVTGLAFLSVNRSEQGRSLKSIECVKVVFQIKFDLLKCFVSVIAIKPSSPNDLSWPGLSKEAKKCLLADASRKNQCPSREKGVLVWRNK